MVHYIQVRKILVTFKISFLSMHAAQGIENKLLVVMNELEIGDSTFLKISYMYKVQIESR